MRGVAGALSLAKKEMKGAWFSLSLNGLFVMFLGLFAAWSLSGVFELEGFGAVGGRIEGFYNAFFTDYLFLVVCAFLGVSAVCGARVAPLAWGGWQDSSPPWGLRLLRTLPLSAGSIVGSRLLCVLFALSFNATLFFVAAYLFTDLGGLGGSYPWFAGIWIGYGLLAAGLYLSMELTVKRSGGAHVLPGSFGFAASLMVFVALLEWTLEPTLVEWTARLAERYGAPAAIFSVLAGGGALFLLSWLAARRIEKRGLTV